MPENEKKFHEALKEYRVLKDLTQNQLSKKTGINRTVLSFLENGHQRPTTQHLIILKDKLGIDFSNTVFADTDRPYYGPPRESESTASTLAEMYNAQREVRMDLLHASDLLKENKESIRELPTQIKGVILAVENLINQAYRKI